MLVVSNYSAVYLSGLLIDLLVSAWSVCKLYVAVEYVRVIVILLCSSMSAAWLNVSLAFWSSGFYGNITVNLICCEPVTLSLWTSNFIPVTLPVIYYFFISVEFCFHVGRCITGTSIGAFSVRFFIDSLRAYFIVCINAVHFIWFWIFCDMKQPLKIITGTIISSLLVTRLFLKFACQIAM